MSSRAWSGVGTAGPVWESRRKRMGSPFGSSLTSSNRIVLQAAIGAPFWGWTRWRQSGGEMGVDAVRGLRRDDPGTLGGEGLAQGGPVVAVVGVVAVAGREAVAAGVVAEPGADRVQVVRRPDGDAEVPAAGLHGRRRGGNEDEQQRCRAR